MPAIIHFCMQRLTGLPEEALYFSFTAGRPSESIFSAWYCYGHDEASVWTIWLRNAIVTCTESVKINRKFKRSISYLNTLYPHYLHFISTHLFKQARVVQVRSVLWQQQIMQNGRASNVSLDGVFFRRMREKNKLKVEYKFVINSHASPDQSSPIFPRASITRYTYAYHERIL